MDELRLPATIDCRVFREFLLALDDGELSPGDREKLEEHRTACRGCRDRLEVERSFSRALRAKIARHRAPEHLESRVRFRLRRESAGAALRWGRPWPSAVALAASVLLALALAPLLSSGTLAGRERPRAGVVPVVREAMIVDLICDQGGRSRRMQHACSVPGHLNALKLSDGTYWGLLADDGPGRQIVWDRASRGRRVVVEGNLYPAIQTLKLIRVKDSLRAREPGRNARIGGDSPA